MSARLHPDDFGRDASVRFRDQSVVESYHLRPQYPEATFALLAGLITDTPRTVLDIGCGSGDLARRLVDRVERVDAVDCSLPMIEKGKGLPNGHHPHLRWIHSAVEATPLDPPYALITAGRSMHWMDWEVIFPRFRKALTPHGSVAILAVKSHVPWDDELRSVIQHYSTPSRARRAKISEELQERHLFEKHGENVTAPVPFRQPLDAYIESFHSHSGLSREYMSKEAADALDKAIHAVVSRYGVGDMIIGEVYAIIIWGRPC